MNNLEVPIVTPVNMPRLGNIKTVLHMGEFVLSLLTLCTVVPVIVTEIRFYGGSQAAPNWTLVVTILTWWIPVVLVYFPWSYDRHNKFRRLGKFFIKSRTNLIFSIFDTFLWAAAAISMTVHANNPAHCALDSDLAQSDQGYASAWPAQCNCAKAAAAFAWLNCLFWLASLISSIIVFWKEKQLARQNRKQNELGKLEQPTDEEAVTILPVNIQQQQQHQHMPAVIQPLPPTTFTPFYQPPSTDPWMVPMPVAPPPAQKLYNNDHYQ